MMDIIFKEEWMILVDEFCRQCLFIHMMKTDMPFSTECLPISFTTTIATARKLSVLRIHEFLIKKRHHDQVDTSQALIHLWHVPIIQRHDLTNNCLTFKETGYNTAIIHE